MNSGWETTEENLAIMERAEFPVHRNRTLYRPRIAADLLRDQSLQTLASLYKQGVNTAPIAKRAICPQVLRAQPDVVGVECRSSTVR